MEMKMKEWKRIEYFPRMENGEHKVIRDQGALLFFIHFHSVLLTLCKVHVAHVLLVIISMLWHFCWLICQDVYFIILFYFYFYFVYCV